MSEFRSALSVLAIGLLGSGAPGLAATVADDPGATIPQGRPLEQRFLSTGASVVTTPEAVLCVASRKIEIAASRYVAADGTEVPFDDVVRSVAASVQAMAGAGDAPAEFRVQLKYSLKPGADAWLDLGAGDRVEVSGLLEPSTDSLLVTGDLAVRLAAAQAAGRPVVLTAVSVDTGRSVTDTLPAPDMAALAACRADLAPAAGDLPPLAALVTLDFLASATPETRASLEDMRACAMTPTDRPVHLGRIRGTTGFFSQTEKVFVAFDEAGRPERVYVPGILDAGLDDLGMGSARISRAANGNVPGDENAVKGCLGSSAEEICVRPMPGDPGAWQLRPCWVVPGIDMVARGLTDPSGSVPPGLLPSPEGPRGTTRVSVGPPPPVTRTPLTPPPSLPPITRTSTPPPGDPPPPPPPPPPAVPLPAAGWLMIGAIAGLAALRRRRRA